MRLLRYLRLNGGKGEVLYISNYELHTGYLQKVVKDREGRERVLHGSGRPHGWHIHGVINRRINLKSWYIRYNLEKCGFGRVDVRPVTTKGISDYLTKHALKAYRGLSRKEREKYSGRRLRLVNASRGLPALNDYQWQSDFLTKKRRMIYEYFMDKRNDGNKAYNALMVSRRCDISIMLGYSHYWQWLRALESMQFLCSSKVLAQCCYSTQVFENQHAENQSCDDGDETTTANVQTI